MRRKIFSPPNTRPAIYDCKDGLSDCTGGVAEIRAETIRMPGARFRRALPTRSDVIVFALCVTMATLLSWFAGAFRTEFGGYPDEAAHYVTALMIRDYIAGWFPTAPLRFAENYYLHYPKVAFGHWPPVFHCIQAVWMLLFSESRNSMLLLTSLLTGSVAFLTYRLVNRYFGILYGLWAAMLYLLLPPVRFNSTMIMTEPALSLFGLLAVLSFARYLEDGSWSSILRFGFWTSVVILTKGDGLCFFLVAPLALLFTKQLGRFASPRLWSAAIMIAVLCAPYTFLTRRMVQQGWAGAFGWSYSSQAAPLQAKLIVSTFGFLLVVLALVGAIKSTKRLPHPPVFACMTAYASGIIIFQMLVPSGVEVRKLMMAFPAILFLAAAGAGYLGELFQNHVRPAFTAATLIVLSTAAWAGFNSTAVHRMEHGYRGVAHYILSNPSLQGAVVLVSTSEPSYSEGMLIAEIASRERRPGHFVLRASKVISHSDWSGEQNYHLLYHTPGEVLQALAKIPVNVVVADYPPTPQSPPHHRLLLDAIQSAPDRWSLVYTRADHAADGGGRTIGVFQAVPIALRRGLNLEVDMTETLGRVLGAAGN